MDPATPDAGPVLVSSNVVVAVSGDRAPAEAAAEQEVAVGQQGVRQRRSEFTGHLQDKLREIYSGLDLGADIGGQHEDDHAKMDRVLDWATHRVQEVTSDSTDMDITHLPASIKEVLKEINEDGDNIITIDELKAAAKAHGESKKRLQEAKDNVKFLRKAVFGLLGIVVLLMAMMFGMSLLAANISKDTGMAGASAPPLTPPKEGEASSNGVMTSKDGKGVVATAQTKIPMTLSSTLGDNQLAHLTMAAFSSDAGHTLHLHVHGFMRVPMVGSRCGSVIYLITQMGRIMLDDSDVSFEDDAAIEELNRMGFVITPGGIGRRLQGSAAAAGFFNMLEGAEEGGFSCGSIEPPQLPTNYKADLITYEMCDPVLPDAAAGDGKNLNCQSDFGGYRPGVMGMPEHLYILTLPDTRRGDKLTSVDITDLGLMERTHRLAWRTDEIVIDAPSFGLVIGEPPHHFGQKQVSVTDKASAVTYSFQVADPIAALFTSGRKYCSKSTSESGNDEAFLEYRGLWVEGDKTYRHWRLMKKSDAEIAFGGTLDPGNVSTFLKENSYEYFDEPETLTPFRLISPSGAFVEYHNYVAATDETVTEYLTKLDLTLEDAIAPECQLEPDVVDEADLADDALVAPPAQGVEVVVPIDPDFAPRIFRSLELEVSDATVYKEKLDAELVREPIREPPLNSGSFGTYLQRVLDPFSAPDYCLKACGITPEKVSRVDGTCALSQEDAECLQTGSGFYSCKWSNLGQTALPCVSPGRRLRWWSNPDNCDMWFQSPPIGAFGFNFCYRGNSAWASGSGSGCGMYGPVTICAGGGLSVGYNGRKSGNVWISASMSIPRLVSATVRAQIDFYHSRVQFTVSGTVEASNYAGGIRGVLRGTYSDRSGFKLSMEVDYYFGWSSWSRYSTYSLM